MAVAKPIFRELNADDPEPETTEIESLCMNCHASGITRLLLTKIPFYKEVVLMSFHCEKCGFHNNEIQSGAATEPEGIRITLKVDKPSDLNRQVVKSDFTSFKIVELDFEAPARSQRGEVTTIEGLIDRSISGLEQDQVLRKALYPEDAEKIEEFIEKLRNLKDVKSPFTIILEDISGNSFIENPSAPQKDPNCTIQYFKRTKEQDHELGVFTREEVAEKSDNEKESNYLQSVKEDPFTFEDLLGEVMQFSVNCPNCAAPCQTNMKMTNVPHFKDVVIMATTCDTCGHRTNEVKSGGGIETHGVHIEIDINGREDFSRDVLKSETCELQIPQMELEVGPRALGGRFTTVEGLLVAIKDQLNDPRYTHIFGDSQTDESKIRLKSFLKQIDEILEGNKKVTLVLDDPAGNSYIQVIELVDIRMLIVISPKARTGLRELDISKNLNCIREYQSLKDDDKLDEGLRITHYERTFEQNDELGLNDIKTENYETS